jgi:ribonuclease BN (tRNA processing enzyme)
VVLYATDTEHTKEPDANVLKVASNADVLIYDAQYTPEEYAGNAGKGGPKVGWGHSTFTAATDIAKIAKAKKLVLFHHDPLQSDDEVRAKERRAKELFPDTIAAYEGLVLEV